MSSSGNCCPPIKPCCPPRPDCIPPRCAQLVGGPKGEILPNAGPCVACGADIYITADFIYWKVREDHLGYVSSTGNQLVAAPGKGKVAQPDFKMRPGFKVGIGMGYDHDGWDTFLQYTWMRSKNNTGSISSTASTTLLDNLWGITGEIEPTGDAVGALTSATVSWELHYFNVLDLELGRNFYVSRYLMLRPHFGFKGTWQKQFLNSAVNTGTTTSFTSQMAQKQFYWGFGIRAGLDAAWHFSRSFSLVGDIAVSGLYGQFEIDRTSTTFNNTAGTFVATDVNPFALSNNFHTIKPVVEWFIGLRWETYTCDNEYHFALEAGWEEQFWGQQNQFIDSVVEGKNGDLNFQGLTVKARFDF